MPIASVKDVEGNSRVPKYYPIQMKKGMLQGAIELPRKIAAPEAPPKANRVRIAAAVQVIGSFRITDRIHLRASPSVIPHAMLLYEQSSEQPNQEHL